MSLNLPLFVKYAGRDSLLTQSPVYESLNIPVSTEPIAGQVRLEIRTYFLVWETQAAKKLFWIEKERCDIVFENN